MKDTIDQILDSCIDYLFALLKPGEAYTEEEIFKKPASIITGLFGINGIRAKQLYDPVYYELYNPMQRGGPFLRYMGDKEKRYIFKDVRSGELVSVNGKRFSIKPGNNGMDQRYIIPEHVQRGFNGPELVERFVTGNEIYAMYAPFIITEDNKKYFDNLAYQLLHIEDVQGWYLVRPLFEIGKMPLKAVIKRKYGQFMESNLSLASEGK